MNSPNLFDVIALPLLRQGGVMLHDDQPSPLSLSDDPEAPMLSEMTRLRLGRQLQALYEPVIDEPLDPRLAELMRQLDADRRR